MAEPFLGEIRAFGFNFNPRGWAKCDGQLLPISSNQALFSLLGTTYGGDGRTTFGLPDLRGRMPMHQGNGPGLTGRRTGARGGAETHTLNTTEIPSHSHGALATSDVGNQVSPINAKLAKANDGESNYSNSTDNLGSIPTTNTGGNQAHNNMPPYLVVNYCIAIQGIFPSRN